jgi:hypothetical protein
MVICSSRELVNHTKAIIPMPVVVVVTTAAMRPRLQLILECKVKTVILARVSANSDTTANILG